MLRAVVKDLKLSVPHSHRDCLLHFHRIHLGLAPCTPEGAAQTMCTSARQQLLIKPQFPQPRIAQAHDECSICAEYHFAHS